MKLPIDEALFEQQCRVFLKKEWNKEIDSKWYKHFKGSYYNHFDEICPDLDITFGFLDENEKTPCINGENLAGTFQTKRAAYYKLVEILIFKIRTKSKLIK